MNKKAHTILGGTAGGLCNIVDQINRREQDPTIRFDWKEFFLCVSAGALAARLPDILEPATNPQHRSICHSGAMTAAVAKLAFGAHTQAWHPMAKALARAAACGYISHNVSDFTTKMSIPLIHPSIC
jgi:hypothetical protein